MADFDIEQSLKTMPLAPGVYLMKDHDDNVVYVGKANNLKQRLKQYFGATSDTRYFVHQLPKVLKQIDTIVTHTVKEALILENDLIKR